MPLREIAKSQIILWDRTYQFIIIEDEKYVSKGWIYLAAKVGLSIWVGEV